MHMQVYTKILVNNVRPAKTVKLLNLETFRLYMYHIDSS